MRDRPKGSWTASETEMASSGTMLRSSGTAMTADEAPAAVAKGMVTSAMPSKKAHLLSLQLNAGSIVVDASLQREIWLYLWGWALRESCVKVRLSSATQSRLASTLWWRLQKILGKIIALSWLMISSGVILHHCIRIFAWCASRPEARLDAQQNKKTVSDFVILSLSQAKKEPAASARVCQALAMRALLVADSGERALAKAAVVDFMESRSGSQLGQRSLGVGRGPNIFVVWQHDEGFSFFLCRPLVFRCARCRKLFASHADPFQPKFFPGLPYLAVALVAPRLRQDETLPFNQDRVPAHMVKWRANEQLAEPAVLQQQTVEQKPHCLRPGPQLHIIYLQWYIKMILCTCSHLSGTGRSRHFSRLTHRWGTREALLRECRRFLDGHVAACSEQLDIGTSKSAPRPSVFNIFTSKCASRQCGVQFFRIRTSKSAPTPSVFQRAIFRHQNFKKCSEHELFCTFWLQSVFFATAACNFWFLRWAPTSAPAALTGLLFNWPNTRIIEITQHSVTSLTFGAHVSSFF